MAENRAVSMGLVPRRRRRLEMNLLPLIDVLVMLIFFAFVTMQFRSVAALNLTLPKVETAGRNEFSSPIVLGIDRNGVFSLNGNSASESELQSLIGAIAAQSTDVTVLLKVDEDTPVKKMTLAMDLCRKAGLNKIRLQSR